MPTPPQSSPPASQAVLAARYGLGRWLAFAFSLLSILVTAVLVLVAQHTAGDQARSSIGANLAELANQTTSRLDRAMFERYREAQLMALRMSRLRDRAQVQTELDAVQRTYPLYAWIGLADRRGKVLAATRGVLAGADVSASEWWKQGRGAPYLGDVHDAQLLASQLPRRGNDPLRLLDIAMPVPGSGEVLGIHLAWTWAEDLQAAIFLPIAREQAAEPLIVAQDGTVLLGPRDVLGQRLQVPSLDAASSRRGFSVERWPDGRDYVVGYGRVRGYQGTPSLGWRVLVRQDLDNAYGPVRGLQLHLALWGLLVAAVFSLVGWLAARFVTRPLKQLAADARVLEAGGAVSGRRPAPYQEVRELGRALRSLVDNLQQKEAALRELNASLERRVDERTAALRQAFEHVRENEGRIQTILESAPDPFIATDMNGLITDWNSRAEALFGWPREDAIGRPLVQLLVPERYRRSADQALEAIRQSGRMPRAGAPIERLVVDRDGREIEVELRLGMVKTGNLQLLCGFMTDIRGRKEVDRLKNEFVSTVSHELRTPLTSVFGSLRLLAGGVGGTLTPQGRQLLELSTRSCERLIRLINDMLDIERIASGRMELKLEPLDLRSVAERAMHDTAAYVQELGVRVRFDAPDAPMPVSADSDRITQVVVNLVSNAAKFSPGGDEVVVTLQADGATARLGVVDHGTGIPPAFRSRVFERFAQADASDRREKGGTGLGLNICRSIVHAHGGAIGFDSEPGVRTEFWFTLPIDRT